MIELAPAPWRAQALCRGAGPEQFFPSELRRGPQEPPPLVLELCPRCPVRALCGSYGRATASLGWWGGELLRNPQRHISRDEVVEVRRRLAAGERHRSIAAELGISKTAVNGIATGQRQSSVA